MQQTRTGRAAMLLICAALLSAAAVSRGAAQQGPRDRNSVPDAYKWNLNDIYPSWEAWEAGLAQLDTMMDDCAGLQSSLSKGPDRLLTAFKLYIANRFHGQRRQPKSA